MTVVESEVTQLARIPYPGEGSDPFYEQYRLQMNVLDEIVHFGSIFPNLYLSGGGTRTWNSATGIFEWSEDWVIPVFRWGYKICVRFGPNGSSRALSIQNNQALVVEVPASLNANRVLNFTVVNALDPQKRNQWVAGWRNGSILQLRGIGEIA